jgi:hypothetical protein
LADSKFAVRSLAFWTGFPAIVTGEYNRRSPIIYCACQFVSIVLLLLGNIRRITCDSSAIEIGF